jgi:hypothetical protein
VWRETGEGGVCELTVPIFTLMSLERNASFTPNTSSSFTSCVTAGFQLSPLRPLRSHRLALPLPPRDDATEHTRSPLRCRRH